MVYPIELIAKVIFVIIRFMTPDQFKNALSVERTRQPEVLEGALRALGQRLLYAPPAMLGEVEGYSLIRQQLGHSDPRVVELVKEQLNARWGKVPLYKRQNPDQYTGRLRSQVDRVTYDSPLLGELTRIALLEIARASKDKQALNRQSLEDRLFPFWGPGIDLKRPIDELKKMCVLLEETGKYIPLIGNPRRIIFAEDALLALEAHTPVLEVISYPDRLVSSEDAEVIMGVRRLLTTSFRRHQTIWRKENFDQLVLPPEERRLDEGDILLDSIHPERVRVEREDPKIACLVPLDNQVVMMLMENHHARENLIKISAYMQPAIATKYLVLDYWGRPLRSYMYGELLFWGGPRKAETIEARGVFKPQIAPGFEDADNVTSSETLFRIEWHDITGQDKQIGLLVAYEKNLPKPEQLAEYGPDRAGTYISTDLAYVQVREKNEKENDISPTGARMSPNRKQIRFDKPYDSFIVVDPYGDGEYQFTYKVDEKMIHIVLKGSDWERNLSIPKVIDPVALTRHMTEKVDEIFRGVANGSKTIKEQVDNREQLSLAQHVAIESTEIGMDLNLWIKQVDTKVRTDSRFIRLAVLQDNVEKLEERERDLMNGYIDKLMQTKRYNLDIGFVRGQRMRMLINEHKLKIPEELLKEAEELLLPDLSNQSRLRLMDSPRDI